MINNLPQENPTSHKLDLSIKPSSFAIRYDQPVPVTRENLAAMLVKSFAVAPNSASKQIVYFEWLKQNVGFDYHSFIEKYLYKADGWQIFSEAEQKFIVDSFEHAKHPKSGSQFQGAIDNFRKNPGQAFNVQLDQIFRLIRAGISKTQIENFRERFGLPLLNEVKEKDLITHLMAW